MPETSSPPCLLGSVTDLDASHSGKTLIVGSHGGAAVGHHALSMKVSGLIFHDAGLGLDDAGIRSLDVFSDQGLPAVSVSHTSARIGDAADMYERGLVSRSNETAGSLGVIQGMPVREAYAVLDHAETRFPDVVVDPEKTFGRYPLPLGVPAVAIDSASSIGDQDIDKAVFTGSHGGLPGSAAGRAIKRPVRMIAFNDAGIGIENAGVSRLSALDGLGIPALAIDCMTARIGDGRSTYETGIVSTSNDTAIRMSLTPGITSKEAVARLTEKP